MLRRNELQPRKSRVELLNDIVHPAVIESLFEQAETAKQLPDCPGVVLDVPLLIESGLHKDATA